MKHKIIIPILAILFFGCQNSSEETQSSTIETEIEKDSAAIDTADFDNSTIEVDPIVISDYPDFSDIPETLDDVQISFEGEGINVWSEVLTDIEVSVQFESAITVMNEGPHCDLIDWIHGYSSWEKLEHLEKFVIDDLGYTQFKFKPFDHERTYPFPITDMNIIRTEVKKTCGEFWANHISEVETPWDYPCAVGSSAFIFKINATHKPSETKKTYLIRLPNEMGC